MGERFTPEARIPGGRLSSKDASGGVSLNGLPMRKGRRNCRRGGLVIWWSVSRPCRELVA
ncbi:hypothetical protein GCM10027456_29040 [Kineosporia babensis]